MWDCHRLVLNLSGYQAGLMAPKETLGQRDKRLALARNKHSTNIV